MSGGELGWIGKADENDEQNKFPQVICPDTILGISLHTKEKIYHPSAPLYISVHSATH